MCSGTLLAAGHTLRSGRSLGSRLVSWTRLPDFNLVIGSPRVFRLDEVPFREADLPQKQRGRTAEPLGERKAMPQGGPARLARALLTEALPEGVAHRGPPGVGNRGQVAPDRCQIAGRRDLLDERGDLPVLHPAYSVRPEEASVLPRIGASFGEVDTPALAIDLDTFERNLRKMAEFARKAGVALRPHAKAHKSPVIARKQIELGAVGITCSKLGEAEAMVDGGVTDILISSQVVGAAKIARLVALARHARIGVVVDDAPNAREISAAAQRIGATVTVLVEVDVGQRRCGVTPGEAAADLAAIVHGLPGVTFGGLQGYEGHLQQMVPARERKTLCDAAMERLGASRRAVEARGIPVAVATTAGTGTCEFAAHHEGVTEIQPGSYIFMDANYVRVEGTPYETALTVWATILSRQRAADAICDAGWKALSIDSGPAIVRGREDLTYSPAGDEYGRISATGAAPLPGPGERVPLTPSHCDTTVNLYDRFVGVRGSVVETVWPITGRGRTD